MSRRASAALASVMLVLSVLVADPAVARDDFRSGVWEGRALPRDGGPFTGCTMDAEYENGIILTFGLTNRYGFALLLSSRAWSLTKGDRYDVVYSVDGAQRYKATAVAYTEHTVYIVLPSTREAFDRMRTGTALLVEAAGGRFRFDLGGTYTALELLLDCVNRNTRIADGSGRKPLAPAAPSRPEPRGQRADRPPQETPRQPPRASPDERARAAAFVEKLLLRAELFSYEILTGERVPARLRKVDVVWQGYHVIGILDILPRGTFRTVDDAANDTVAVNETSCDGKLSSKGHALRLDDGRRIVQVAVVCVRKDEEVHLDYTIMPVAEGGFYRIVHVSSADPEAGRAANERIGEALLAMLAGK